MNKQEMISAVLSMSAEDLKQLNNIVVAELNSRIRMKQKEAKAALWVGDKVSFTGKNGRPNIARIIKINQKTIDVMIDSDTGYAKNAMVRVSSTLLTRI